MWVISRTCIADQLRVPDPVITLSRFSLTKDCRCRSKFNNGNRQPFDYSCSSRYMNFSMKIRGEKKVKNVWNQKVRENSRSKKQSKVGTRYEEQMKEKIDIFWLVFFIFYRMFPLLVPYLIWLQRASNMPWAVVTWRASNTLLPYRFCRCHRGLKRKEAIRQMRKTSDCFFPLVC